MSLSPLPFNGTQHAPLCHLLPPSQVRALLPPPLAERPPQLDLLPPSQLPGPNPLLTLRPCSNLTRQLFPGAKVVASTMDAFVEAAETHAHKLPLVTGEIAE